MSPQEEAEIEAAKWIAEKTGAYPELFASDDDGFIFENTPSKLALDLFPYSEEEQGHLSYEVINAEQQDDFGWYFEAILFSKTPALCEKGSIVEGLYSRKLNGEGLEIEARFEGRVVFTDDHDKHAEALVRMNDKHHARAVEAMAVEVKHLLDAIARLADHTSPETQFNLHSAPEAAAKMLRALARKEAAHG